MSWQGRLLMRAALTLTMLSPMVALSAEPSGQNPYSKLSIKEIEVEIERTEAQLDQLPLRLIRESGGTLGFRAHKNKGLY